MNEVGKKRSEFVETLQTEPEKLLTDEEFSWLEAWQKAKFELDYIGEVKKLACYDKETTPYCVEMPYINRIW